jgi:hypothetical protein
MSQKIISRVRPVQVRERRRRRTEDVMEALHLQLDACRLDGDFEAMVVADEHGMCLASSGLPATCLEIAARLPIIGRKTDGWAGTLLGAAGGVAVAMKKIDLDGATQLYACAVGGEQTRHQGELSRAENGVRRILAV